MADIRIKDLAVTAGSSASDDYLAVDGATNGTRKLSAYSPTFGGNVTASNNLTVGGDVTLSTNNTYLKGKTSGGSSVNLLSLTSDTNNLTRFIAGVDAGGFQWTNQAQSAAWLALNSSGLFTSLNITAGSATTPKGKIDAQGTYDGSAPSTSSTPIIRANNGGAISLWVGGNAYSNMWMQAIQDDGSNNIKNIYFQPLGGDVDFGGNATFAGKISATSSGTNIVQLNLPFTSRITLGEGATNNANPAITLYRTTGGAAQGTAIRLYQPNSTGDFQIQKGTTNAVYGTETYTTQAQFTYNGNFIVGSVADNGNKLQVDGSAFIAGNLTNYNQRILRGPSSNSDATLVPVVAEFAKSSGNVGTTTATVVITGTVGASGAWREGMIEVYAATCNNYSGDEGGINELVTFQHDSSTGLNPRNFTVIRTNSAGSAITITYAGTSPTTFTITVSRTDPSVPGTVPAHEVFAYVRVINSNAISFS